MPFGLWAQNGPRNHDVQIPHEKGQFLGKGSPIVKYKDFLPWVVQKRLNRSICRLGCGVGWAEKSTSSIIFARWRQCAHMEGHIGATWRIRFNRPSVAAMRSYGKLLWPLVVVVVVVVVTAIIIIVYYRNPTAQIFINKPRRLSEV